MQGHTCPNPHQNFAADVRILLSIWARVFKCSALFSRVRWALGLEFGSAAQLSKRPGSVWNYLWGNALKRSPGIIRKSRVSYPGPVFLSSATWPSLPKKHYNGFNQTKPVYPK